MFFTLSMSYCVTIVTARPPRPTNLTNLTKSIHMYKCNHSYNYDGTVHVASYPATCSGCPSHSVNVVLGAGRHISIHHHANTGDIKTSTYRYYAW